MENLLKCSFFGSFQTPGQTHKLTHVQIDRQAGRKGINRALTRELSAVVKGKIGSIKLCHVIERAFTNPPTRKFALSAHSKYRKSTYWISFILTAVICFLVASKSKCHHHERMPFWIEQTDKFPTTVATVRSGFFCPIVNESLVFIDTDWLTDKTERARGKHTRRDFMENHFPYLYLKLSG